MRVAARIILALWITAGPLAAWGAVVELKDGSKIEGTIVEKTSTDVHINTEGIDVRIHGDEIKTLDGLPFNCDFKALYEQKSIEIGVNDVEGHFKLALWCSEHNLKAEMDIQIEKVLMLDPNHGGARRKLGQVFFQNEWRTPDELKKLGFVRKGGEWLTPDQAAQAEGKVTYKGNWVREEDRKRLEARRFSRYTDSYCGFTTHTICELNRDIMAIQLLNWWNPAPQQLKQMWAVLNEAEADRQVFMQKRAELAEEVESAFIALRNEALKGVVDSFNQSPVVEGRAGSAQKAYRSLHKGCDFKLNTHSDKFMNILTPAQKTIFQDKYCTQCHGSHAATKGLGAGREYRGTQAGVDFLTRARSLSEEQFNAQMVDLAQEALKKFSKGPQTLLGKKAVAAGKRSAQDMDAEEAQVADILKRARLMDDMTFERKKFNTAAELEAPNQEERLRIIVETSRSKMGVMGNSLKMQSMVSDALFDGALRRAVGAKLGIPKEQQVVKARSGEAAVPEFADGKQAFDAMCTMCHSTDRINKARKDPQGWRATVQKMLGVSWGDMTKNINLITDYLVNRKTEQAAK